MNSMIAKQRTHQYLINKLIKLDIKLFNELKQFQPVWIWIHVILCLYKQIVSAALATIMKWNEYLQECR